MAVTVPLLGLVNYFVNGGVSKTAEAVSNAVDTGSFITTGNTYKSKTKVEPKYSSEYYEYPKPSFNGVQNSAINLALNDGYAFKDENYINFDRFYTINPADEYPSGFHYVFFCRPDCYLIDLVNARTDTYQLSSKSRVARDSTMQAMYSQYPKIIQSLCAEFGNGTKTTQMYASASGYGNSTTTDGSTDMSGNSMTIHSLIPLLTGRVQSIQIPDYTVKTFNITQPLTRYTLPFGLNAIESTTGGSFDVTFREDKDFTISRLFYTWLYYMDGVTRNIFRPKDKYMLYNALDYATSVYDIIVDPTGETIKWFGKYTGVIPSTVPLSTWGFNKGGSPEKDVSISFQYFQYEALNPEILTDFNYNSLGYIYMRNHAGTTPNISYVNPYNSAMVGPDKALVGRPYVVLDDGEFKLRWMPPV